MVRVGSVQPFATTRGVPQPKFSPSMFGNARTSPFGSTAMISARPSPSSSPQPARRGSYQPYTTTRGVPQPNISPSTIANARPSPFGSTALISARPFPYTSPFRARVGSVQPFATTRGVPQPKFSPSTFGNARTSPFGSTETNSARASPDNELPPSIRLT